MATSKDSPASDEVLGADSAPSPRYVATARFTARFHTQLVTFEAGDPLDSNVAEYFLGRGLDDRISVDPSPAG